MGDSPPAICNQCGYALGTPEEEVAHPDDENPPEKAHFQVQIREDDEERMQCTETGRLASPVAPEDDDYIEACRDTGRDDILDALDVESDEGEAKEQQTQQQQQRQTSTTDTSNEIFDFEEEKSQMDILAEVVTNPHYDLTDEQVIEIKSWAEDYDGQMPPNVLEDLVGNMSGVQKQTAKLIRQRYELKLNRWVQKQSQPDDGPPIGITHGSPVGGGGVSRSRNRQKQQTPQPQPQQKKDSSDTNDVDSIEDVDIDDRESDDSFGGLPNDDVRKERRKRRVERRNEVLDITAEEAAKQAAPELAKEITSNFGTYFGLPAKILEAKAEKDPDWFLEKLEQLDLDIDDIMEPSERRKQEMKNKNQTQPQVDNKMDNALENIKSDNGQNNNVEPSTDDNPMRASPDTKPNNDNVEPEDKNSTPNTQESEDNPYAKLQSEDNTTDETQDDNDMFEETFGNLEVN